MTENMKAVVGLGFVVDAVWHPLCVLVQEERASSLFREASVGDGSLKFDGEQVGLGSGMEG